MNIFALDKDPIVAQMSCDKHIVKMILEMLKCYVQAKRVLDTEYFDKQRMEEISKDALIILMKNNYLQMS